MDAKAIEPRGELDEIAARMRSRVAEDNLWYPQVREPFDAVCCFKQDGQSVSWYTNGRLFLLLVDARSEVVFAVGRPDPILGSVEPLGASEAGVIFCGPERRPTAWLSSPGNVSLIAKLGLTDQEQLVVSRNRVFLLIEPGGIDMDSSRLRCLQALVDALPSDAPPTGTGELIDGLRFDAAAVDPALQQLLPVIRRWACGDDGQRSDRIAGASDRDLASLMDAVEPLLSRIDDLAETEPLPDEAILLGRVAEAALEAGHELERRLAADPST
jgi:hypothetical protein